MRTRLAFVLAALAISIPDPLAAQRPLPLLSGERVRVASPGPEGRPAHYQYGDLLRLRADTVVLRSLDRGPASPETLTVALAPGRRLEVLAARGRDHGLDGMLIGGLVGAVAGAVVGASADKPGLFHGYVTFQATMLGISAGGLIGWAIGRSQRTETWAPVETAGMRVGLAPLPDRRLGVHATFSF